MVSLIPKGHTQLTWVELKHYKGISSGITLSVVCVYIDLFVVNVHCRVQKMHFKRVKANYLFKKLLFYCFCDFGRWSSAITNFVKNLNVTGLSCN